MMQSKVELDGFKNSSGIFMIAFEGVTLLKYSGTHVEYTGQYHDYFFLVSTISTHTFM